MTLAVVAAGAGLGGAVAAFAQVVMIDLMLASDNAVAVGMAASGLEPKKRRQAIVLGLAGAVVMLIGFALIAVKLLSIIGLLLAGGLLLLWVCWKMYRDLRQHGAEEAAERDIAHAAAGEECMEPVAPKRAKTLGAALFQILLADISMSLDNVLAVAGAAREHPSVLIFGLLLSVTLMGVAASFIAKLMMRFRWLGWVGLAIVIFVAGRMVWEGHRDLVVDLGKTAAYNAAVPDFMDISPKEQADHAK